MNNRERYRKVFNRYYASAIDDVAVFRAKENRGRNNQKVMPRRTAAVLFVACILSVATLVGAATGWFQLGELFRKSFDDPISADLVEAGIVQELNIVNENDDFILKLVAFTGDSETQKVLFELIPKRDLGDFAEISLLGQTFSPDVLESESYDRYTVTEVKGREVAIRDGESAYYFNYKLPPYCVRDRNDDIVLRVKGIRVYDGEGYFSRINCDMVFRFTPNREMLEQSLIIEVNQPITKDVYEKCGFTDDYTNSYLYTGEILAPVTERTIQITDVTVSNYKTVVNGVIVEEDITQDEANSIWNQFTEPIFITHHYWNGLEDKIAYQLAVVDNTKRIRLFVDGEEMPINEESLRYLPGKGHDEFGNLKTEGYYSCAIEFAGFDYETAQKVEIHFGDTVIPLK